MEENESGVLMYSVRARMDTARSVHLRRGEIIFPQHNCGTMVTVTQEFRCVMLEMTECDKFGVCRSHEQNCTLL